MVVACLGISCPPMASGAPLATDCGLRLNVNDGEGDGDGEGEGVGEGLGDGSVAPVRTPPV